MSASPPSPECPQALVAIGEQLRQARLERGLSQSELASQLNMGLVQVQALEDADLSLLPEPVFVVAQLRRMAERLGVDIEASLQGLRQSLQQIYVSRPVTPAPAAAPRPQHPRGSTARRGGRWRWRWPILALVGIPLLAGLGWQAWRDLPASPEAKGRSPIATPPPAAPKRAPGPPPLARELQLSSRQASWLAVRDSRGRMLFEGNFQGRRNFPLGQGLTVLAGRPDLVQVQIGSGAARRLGPINAVRWQRFNPQQP